MGFIEKLLPGTIPLTEEQFKTFVEQTIATEHSRRILDGLTAQNAATAPAQGAGTAGRGNTQNTQPAAKAAHPAQEARRRGNGFAERGREVLFFLASLDGGRSRRGVNRKWEFRSNQLFTPKKVTTV